MINKITREDLTKDLQTCIEISMQIAKSDYTLRDDLYNKYSWSLDKALYILKEFNEEVYYQIEKDGTVGNEAKIFAEAFRHV